MSEWQPIETAPRTFQLVQLGWWTVIENVEVWHIEAGKAWHIGPGKFGFNHELFQHQQATHWKPLQKEPPK